MSGVLKSVGKAFKTVTKPVVKLVKKQIALDKKIAKKVWSNKYLRIIAIAVAVYFTAGAALAYFGAAGAAGGAAAAGATATAGAAAGTTAMATGAAVGAATATTAAAATATTLSAVTVTATVGAAGVGAVTAGTIAAASVGVAAGIAASDAASSSASNAMQNGGGTPTGAPGGTAVSSDGIPTLGTTNVTADIPATGASNFGAFDASDLAMDTSFAVKDDVGKVGPAESNKVDVTLNANGTPKTMLDKAKDLVTNPFSSQNNVAQFDDAGNVIGAPAGGTAAAASPTSSLMGSMGKTMLLKSAVDFASAYMSRPPGPQEPLQYGGYDKNGNGPGMALHTIDNGTGLATGGAGQAPLTGGVPGVLRAGAAQMAPLSPIGTAGNFAANSPSPSPGTPSAGLVPRQGAIDYMGGAS